MGYSPRLTNRPGRPLDTTAPRASTSLRIVEEYVPAGEGAPQAEVSQRRRCTAGRAARGALSAPAPQQQPRPR
ncbi:hypothetical protein NDU88_003322 [Pleurodeles waltl]|uniref:Uncharacterized protein n=1 Tax=Pleurodeles waltl TaxID=8319 RepID=A0AAV7V228_PLEWA|nr:hypothetical protein NDU88_003322 [Pleurodeles waltl]